MAGWLGHDGGEALSQLTLVSAHPNGPFAGDEDSQEEL